MSTEANYHVQTNYNVFYILFCLDDLVFKTVS